MGHNKNKLILVNEPYSNGYTIVETLIFLAVSALLAISGIALMSGRQRSTEFTQAVNELESQLRDIANDVTTGYFPNPGNIGCVANPATADQPSITTAVVTQNPGTNSNCIYVGRVVQFDTDDMRVYTALGRRQANSIDVSTVLDARPKLLARRSAADTTTPENIETVAILPAITIANIKYTDNSGTSNYAAGIGFFTTFGKDSTISSSASLSTEIVPVLTTSSSPGIVTDQFIFVDGFDDYYSDWLPSKAGNQSAHDSAANTIEGVAICVNGDGVKRYAIIRLGARRADGSSTSVEIRNGACPA